MWTLIKIAWRNLFRQRRRTAITASAMALSLIIAIPYYGLTEGLSAEMLKGITRMELGHAQVHDPAYPRGRALQSTLRKPDQLLTEVRGTDGVVAAAPRVHGNALASHDIKLPITLSPLPDGPADDNTAQVRFGRPPKADAPWRSDPALACEAVVPTSTGRKHAVTVGTVFTPAAARPGEACERVRVVGLLANGRPSTTNSRTMTRTRTKTRGAEAPLVVYLPAEDLQRAFGRQQLDTEAVLRHSAALAVEGIEPAEEKRITFMAEKIVDGRYLSAGPKDEIVVGFRLARVMRLKIGSKLFMQAASLDNTSGSFYQDFTVVGIYRTGVDMIDRTRVFVHIRDAQRIMALEQRVHEIVVMGNNARMTKPLVDALRGRLAKLRLQVQAGGQGKRGGSRALPAPVAVYEPIDGDAGLLIPYDLKRRFDNLPGVKGIARRVYTKTTLSRAQAAQTPQKPQPVRVVGVEQALEQRLSRLHEKLTRGNYFGGGQADTSSTDDTWPLLLSERAATAHGVDVGGTVLVHARDVDGNPRWQAGKVVGVLADAKWDAALPQMVLPYFLAQQIDAPTLNARAQEILPLPAPGSAPDELIGALAGQLAPMTRSWQQIAPDMAKLIQTQDAWIGIVLLIIFAIAAMTVMNTMLMAVFERTKEFGVLKSIGLKPWQVFSLITLETLALASMAVIVGGLGGAALNHYLMVHGLDLSSFTGGFTYQGTFIDPVWRTVVTIKIMVLPIIMVLLVCFFVSLYPAFRAGRLQPVKALRYQG